MNGLIDQTPVKPSRSDKNIDNSTILNQVKIE